MNLSLFDAASEAADRPALIANDREYTFAELAELVAGAMETLPKASCENERTVVPTAITGEPSLPVIVHLYAMFEQGLPALIVHPRWTAPERRDALRDIDVSIDLRDPTMPRRREPAREGAAPVDDGRPLVILHTSGTTSSPKGVVLSRKAFVASAAASAANLGWNDDDRWLLSMPLSHVGGLSIITRCLIARRAVVLEPRFDAERVIETVARRKVTILSLVPVMLRRLLDHTPPWRPPAHLRAVLTGGDALPADLRSEAVDRGVPILATYGLTETCSQAATERYGDAPRRERTGVPFLDRIEGRIREGRIEIRGDVLMSGYFPPGRHASPFTDDGWLRTGDAGRIDDRGRLHVFGRADDVIISGGENVSIAEVESALRGMTGVKEACVFALPSAKWGETVCAAIVPAGKELDADRLAAEARLRLAPHKLPRRFVIVDAIPRLPSGGPDRRALRSTS